MTNTRPHATCPHCHLHMPVKWLPTHLADTGAATELPLGACPVLFQRRNVRKAGAWLGAALVHPVTGEVAA